MTQKKRTDITALLEMKTRGERICMLTAYDFPTARILDEAGVETILVGDSAGNVVLGYTDTVPVSMDEMIMLSRAVVRGAKHAFVIGDMPFMSYNVSRSKAIENAGRFIKEAGTQAVKLEGGDAVAATVREITRAGIPVVGHLGLTPQTANMLGGYKVQGRTAAAAKRIFDEAQMLVDAGAIMIVVECIPDKVAEIIRDAIPVPLIGIGAGRGCDGQVLVIHDMLGFGGGYLPKFVRKYGKISEEIRRCVDQYILDVKRSEFPGEEQTFHMEEAEHRKLIGLISAAQSEPSEV